MSNKAKLVLTISFFLIIILLMGICGYKILSTKNEEVLLASSESTNVNTKIEEIPQKDEEIIVVVLNKKQNKPEETAKNDEQEQENEEEEQKAETTASTENTNTQTNSQSNINTESYYIKVNYGANVVNVYTKDINGNYVIPYKAFTCSTGTATPTSGTYNVDYKYRWLRTIW